MSELTKTRKTSQISPDWVRISMAAAIELGLKPGRMFRGCSCGCISGAVRSIRNVAHRVIKIS